jgi:hypothetical protein
MTRQPITSDNLPSQAPKAPKPTSKTAFAAIVATFRERLPDLDTQGQAVLDRLLADDRAGDAFAAIAPDYENARWLIFDGIKADALARTFGERIACEREMVQRLDRLDVAVSDLDKFWKEVSTPPDDPFAAWQTVSDEDAATVRRALYALSCAIAGRRRIASETPLRLGATRKTKAAAAQIAAIGWLADGVQRITQQPHTGHVAILAEIALGIGEVSEERVRKALRTRRNREWRQGGSFTPKILVERVRR